MSTPTVDRILVAPKSYVVNSDRSYRVHKVANLPEREILNFADPQFSHLVDPHVRRNNVIHCAADPQVIKM